MAEIIFPNNTNVVAYFRTSSATNVGEDKDSDKRQRTAVEAYAARYGLKIVKEFYDADVQGKVHVESRPEFAEMLSFMKEAGITVILIETANRFARKALVQMTGYEMLRNMGIDLIPVDSPDHFLSDDPMSEAIRGIVAVISQLEKDMLVKKLKSGRDRKRKLTGRCEGRKQAPVEARAMAKKLKADGLTLRGVSKRLAESGFTVMKKVDGVMVMTGKPYEAQSVKAMLNG